MPKLNDNNIRHSLNKTPLWEKASIRKISIGEAVVVPIKYENKILLKREDDEENNPVSLDNSSYLMIYRDEADQLQAEWVTAIRDKTSLGDDFVGIIEIEHWNGKFKRSFAFGTKGDILPLQLSGATTYKQINHVLSSYCITITHYGYVMDYPQIIGSETFCFVTSDGNTNNDVKPKTGGGGGGTSPTDYSYTIDCAGVINGTAYWSTECSTCLGGTTGLTACPPLADIEKDSLKKYYPCMDKLVLQKLEDNNSYNKLIQPFQAIVLPNGTTITLPGLPKLVFDFSTQYYGGATSNYQLGETERIIGSGMSSIIRFNSAAMNNASKLFLQAASIHEAAHAYANFYYKSAYYGVPVDTAKYSTWAMNIARLDALASGQIQSGNFNDHSMFLENYVDKFVTILKELNGTIYTDKEYQMAALFGLNNPGQSPLDPIGVTIYNIYKSKLDKSYNNLLNKFGITASQINSFNADNLINVPATKKLPTNCP